MWVRTNSLATPLPKQLTASTTTSHSSMKVVGIKKEKMTHGYFPDWPRFDNFPTLIRVKIMPLLNLVAAIVAGRVHLINYRCIFT